MFQLLRWRLSAIFIGFLLLVVAAVCATFLVIQTQQADAAVINLAGRQRMLSQRMLWLATSQPAGPELARAIQLFDQTLHALREGGPALEPHGQWIELPATTDADLRAQLAEAAQTWAIFQAQLSQPDQAALPATSSLLLVQLDQIVHAYEAQSQAKLGRLQLIQGVFLLAALALVAAGYYVLRCQVLRPLTALDQAARRMAQGDLTHPVPTVRPDELGEVAQAFDFMRTEIASAHSQLESRVAQRTRELTSAFELSQEIVGQIDLARLIDSVTDRARALTRASSASLCLIEHDPHLLTLVATSGGDPALLHVQQTLNRDPARQVIEDGATVVVNTICANCRFLCTQAAGRSVIAPLRTGATTLGALCVVRQDGVDFDANETRALTLLANSAAVAVANARLVEQQKRQAEQAAAAAERDRLAAELHDNLAQTLSFLNLKSDRVRELLEGQQRERAASELGQMKLAIGAAYSQVRAALTGLREPAPDADNLRTRLSDCVTEMSTLSGVPVELNIIDTAALALPRVTQTQAYHIVREALANVRRHAQAQQASVTVSRQNGAACFIVEDDGQGFERGGVDEQHHLGLNIMRTRAERCGGSLSVESAVGRGTKIIARLPVAEKNSVRRQSPTLETLRPPSAGNALADEGYEQFQAERGD